VSGIDDTQDCEKLNDPTDDDAVGGVQCLVDSDYLTITTPGFTGGYLFLNYYYCGLKLPFSAVACESALEANLRQ